MVKLKQDLLLENEELRNQLHDMAQEYLDLLGENDSLKVSCYFLNNEVKRLQQALWKSLDHRLAQAIVTEDLDCTPN